MIFPLLLACANYGRNDNPATDEDPRLAAEDTASDTPPADSGDSDTGGATAPVAGDLWITELMMAPNAVDDDFGEWFEVYNRSGRSLDLGGVSAVDDDGDGVELAPIVIPARGRLVFGASAELAENGGAPVDQAYDVDALKFGRSGDSLTLTLDGEVLASFEWGSGFPVEEGRSLSLAPDVQDPSRFADAASWCAASSAYGDGDRGTPGAENDPCPPPDPADADGDGVLDPDDCDPDDPGVYPGAVEIANMKDDDCDGLTDERGPGPGDLVITEIMKNPDPTPDETGEWFEVVNSASVPLLLSGLSVTDNGGTGFKVTGDVVLDPGALLVFGLSADTAVNGGYTPDYVYAEAELRLSNGSDQVTLAFAGILVDEVAYDDDFPDKDGRSLSLDPGRGSVSLNDDPDSWCSGDSDYGTDGNRGTPGSVNDPC
jgi:hypothetical protein